LSLPVDIILCLFRYTSIADALSMRQTCRSFHLITHSRCVWNLLLTTLVEQKNIPIPGLANRPSLSLSASELEGLARKTLSLHRNWTSLSPIPSNKLTIKCDSLPMQQERSAPIFEFLPGSGQRYMISLRKTRRLDLVFDLQCWDLHATPPTCIAKRTVDRCCWFVVNTTQGSPVLLAIHKYVPQCGVHRTELLGIDFSATNPASGFVIIMKFPDRTDRLVALHGAWVVSRDEHHHLYLWNTLSTNPGNHVEMKSCDETTETILEVLIEGDAVIVIRLTKLEIYALCWADTGKSAIYPVAQHRWQWNLDSVSMAPQISWSPNEGKYLPINILLRFGSRLPWPVNLIHHFMLHPELSFDSSRPITASNVPYDAVPVLRRQIGSPVRLFSSYHMAVGSRGTAVWIDNHTEDYFGRGDCGQRLAGSLPVVAKVEDREWDDDSMEIESSMESSVFSYCENDEWTRVAVDEEEGRIAVGYLDGSIVVHEYA
ncbi:hypothetical protein FPV67DRAFT_1727793, partial [Lyophyllum atratum]